MLESLEIIIEFGLGLAGFAGIVVALAGDPKSWTEGERLRVFGLIASALLASFACFSCIALAQHYSTDTAIRISSTIFFIVSVFFFPRQVYRTLRVFRTLKENYSFPVSIFLASVTIAILALSFGAAAGLFAKPLFPFYSALVLALFFSSVIYVRLLLYRPAGAKKKLGSIKSNSKPDNS